MDKVKNNWIWVKDWALEMQKEPVMMYFQRHGITDGSGTISSEDFRRYKI